jgi:hypothetical protein
MSICLRRRKVIAALGGAAAWPLAVRAQQRAMPLIGYISSRTAESDASLLVSLRRGLADVGYAAGRNVAKPLSYETRNAVEAPSAEVLAHDSGGYRFRPCPRSGSPTAATAARPASSS